ncbi:unnamed protein product [Ilex paraguariensis]|uniref:Proline-rich protein PRCC n=1 Tax=Ilex paraguariensis TaxID=185542 RepID=A0ABC8RCR6_9AQUA
MDSLVANYASSDEEVEEGGSEKQQEGNPSKSADYVSKSTSNLSDTDKNSSSSSFFSSLPPPKSSSSSSSSSSLVFLPPPKTHLLNPSSSNSNSSQIFAEEDEEGQPSTTPKLFDPAKPTSFASLPRPKSSAIPQPKIQNDRPVNTSSFFSSLPPPKTQNSDPPVLSKPLSSSDPKPKKVVQFRPPIIPINSRDVDDEDDDEKEIQKKKSKESESSTQTSSVKQSFSSMLPKPKNSGALGALPSASGIGRRSILEADTPAPSLSNFNPLSEVGVNTNMGNHESQSVGGSSLSSIGAVGDSLEYAVGGDISNWGSAGENYVNYNSYGGYGNAGGDSSNWGSGSENYANYDSYAGYVNHGEHGNYGHYEDSRVDGSAATVPPEMSVAAESGVRVPGKKGRNDVPQEIVEVRQDELMKNRPREDQAKLTGIAFGPSYQPVSTKGKPTKLHKRKHQIGSLYFDMRQKEMELAERRARGFLTKAETQAKYGW